MGHSLTKKAIKKITKANNIVLDKRTDLSKKQYNKNKLVNNTRGYKGMFAINTYNVNDKIYVNVVNNITLIDDHNINNTFFEPGFCFYNGFKVIINNDFFKYDENNLKYRNEITDTNYVVLFFDKILIILGNATYYCKIRLFKDVETLENLKIISPYFSYIILGFINYRHAINYINEDDKLINLKPSVEVTQVWLDNIIRIYVKGSY